MYNVVLKIYTRSQNELRALNYNEFSSYCTKVRNYVFCENALYWRNKNSIIIVWILSSINLYNHRVSLNSFNNSISKLATH